MSGVTYSKTWSNGETLTHTDLNANFTAVNTAVGAASGLASLNSSSLVVENPANATATATASKIPIANGSGKLVSGWGGAASTLATLDSNTRLVESSRSMTQFKANSTVAGGETWYLPIFGWTGIGSATESYAAVWMPYSGVINNLAAQTPVNTLSSTTVITLRKNGADTALTVTITAGSTNLFTDSVNEVSFAAGDRIDWKLVTAGAGDINYFGITAVLIM